MLSLWSLQKKILQCKECTYEINSLHLQMAHAHIFTSGQVIAEEKEVHAEVCRPCENICVENVQMYILAHLQAIYFFLNFN